MNWTVRIYDGEEVIESFDIEDRNEQQAEKECIHEVEQHYAGKYWTMTERKDNGDT